MADFPELDQMIRGTGGDITMMDIALRHAKNRGRCGHWRMEASPVKRAAQLECHRCHLDILVPLARKAEPLKKAVEAALRIKELWLPPEETGPEREDEARALGAMLVYFESAIKHGDGPAAVAGEGFNNEYVEALRTMPFEGHIHLAYRAWHSTAEEVAQAIGAPVELVQSWVMRYCPRKP